MILDVTMASGGHVPHFGRFVAAKALFEEKLLGEEEMFDTHHGVKSWLNTSLT